MRAPAPLRYAALPVAFAIGWAAHRPAVVPRAEAIAALPVAAAGTGCVDTAAMKANENLVAQLQDQRRAALAATESARDAQGRLARANEARRVPAAVAPARDEWARMARTKRVRLRTPCASWDAGGRGRAHELRRRAADAGLGEGELDALAAAYEAAHARTWKAMRAACEEGPLFAQAIAESAPSSDGDRVAICQASLLPDEDGARGAVQRVAESRAAGKGVPGASPEERVAWAIGESTEVLFDEMKRALGEETALRAIDEGVICTEERVVDTSPSE